MKRRTSRDAPHGKRTRVSANPDSSGAREFVDDVATDALALQSGKSDGNKAANDIGYSLCEPESETLPPNSSTPAADLLPRGFEVGAEEEIDHKELAALIAADAPARRTRGAEQRSIDESRGSALRTRRAEQRRGGSSTSVSTNFAAATPRNVRRVIVVGAGYAGITAARTLTSMGYSVHVVEGRNRIGGRVHSLQCRAALASSATASASSGGPSSGTGSEGISAAVPATGGGGGATSGAVTVELGAAVLMGDVRGGNPLARLCLKHGVAMHKLDGHCPLHDTAAGGALLPEDADSQAEKLFNTLLEMAHEERMAVAASADTDAQPASPGVHHSAAVVGTPLEALWDEGWFPGRVVDVKGADTRAAQVLFHYEGWNRRFDEWLPVRSVRLRNVSMQHQALEQVLQRQLIRSALPLDKPSQRALHWHLANLEFACAAPLTSVSAKDWDQDDENDFDGDHAILPQGGYGRLLAKLAEGLEIRLRCTVRGIHHSAEGVALDTSNGVLRADAVVVTLPLGVLQLKPQDGGVMFSPPLPAEKQQALGRLGFGVLNKVALFFDAPFWQHTSNFFGRVVANPKHRGRFFLFFNLLPASGAPVLLALAAGTAAVELEESADEVVTQHAVAALRSMFGEHVPPPTQTIVTRWGADRFARGSYSYVHVGASGQDYATLGEPVGERLYFAGEHTIMEHPATVVGAYLSGLRAARALHQRSKHLAKVGENTPAEAAAVGAMPPPRPVTRTAEAVAAVPSRRPPPATAPQSRKPSAPRTAANSEAESLSAGPPPPHKLQPASHASALLSALPPLRRLSTSRDGVRRRSSSLSPRAAARRGYPPLALAERAALLRAARDDCF